MDILKNKTYAKYDYTCRYTTVPYSYHSKDKKYIYHIGTNMKKSTSYVLHEIKPEDTLNSLALTYYNNPTLFWVIAYFNDIQDAFINLEEEGYEFIKIPALLGIQFGDER